MKVLMSLLGIILISCAVRNLWKQFDSSRWIFLQMIFFILFEIGWIFVMINK